VKLNIADSFLPENDGSLLLHFESGKVQVMPENADFDVELSMDIAEFSSLAMGAIDLKSLHKYGLAKLSDATYLDRLNLIFASDRPICTTSF
jgi:predicted acetyltransferase